MTRLNDKLWWVLMGMALAVFTLTGTFMGLNQAWPKITMAAVFIICGVMLVISGIDDLKPKATDHTDRNESGTSSQPTTVLPTTPEKPSRTKTIEDREDPDLLKAEGYTLTDHPHRWEKDGPDSDAPFDEQQVVIYDESGLWLTTASVFVVLNDCAWAPGSAKYFKNRNETDCRLETLLAFPEFKDRLSSARHLVFVGMESYIGAPKAASSQECDHQFLTECRVDRLVTRTYNAYFNDEAEVRPGLWELDLGYAKTKSSALEWYQRRALIIGVRNRRSALDVEHAVTTIASGTKVGTVKLSDYSNAATAQAQNIPYDVWGNGGAPDSHH